MSIEVIKDGIVYTLENCKHCNCRARFQENIIISIPLQYMIYCNECDFTVQNPVSEASMQEAVDAWNLQQVSES